MTEQNYAHGQLIPSRERGGGGAAQVPARSGDDRQSDSKYRPRYRAQAGAIISSVLTKFDNSDGWRSSVATINYSRPAGGGGAFPILSFFLSPLPTSRSRGSDDRTRSSSSESTLWINAASLRWRGAATRALSPFSLGLSDGSFP